MKYLFILLTSLYCINLHSVELNDYFKNSFEESDLAFENSYRTIKSIQPKAEMHKFTYEQGAIKSIYWPAKNTSNKLLILISGTHGVEAFAGSAVQRWLVDQKWMQNLENINILLIHGFNVYGFKHGRRVNEDNIDLNRNFVIDRSTWQKSDSEYKNLDDFLNPQTTASYGLFQKIAFISSAVGKIVKYGLDNLRNPILSGQYSYPKGVFYGGTMIAKQWELINDLIDKYVNGKNKVFIVDLHTGYGARGKLHLLANGTKAQNPLLKIFKAENEIDFGSDNKFYSVQGDLLSFFIHEIQYRLKAQAPESMGITYEYGTLDSQKLLGSIESLRRIVFENQNHWYPAKIQQDAEKIKTDFVEMFNPPDSKWRKTILDQTEEKTKKILDWLGK